MIIAAALAVRVKWPRFIGQPARGFAHRSAARGATCLTAAGGGGGGCMMVDGGDGMRGGGGGAGALARISAAAQALYEAQLHGFGRGLGRLLANLHTQVLK